MWLFYALLPLIGIVHTCVEDYLFEQGQSTSGYTIKKYDFPHLVTTHSEWVFKEMWNLMGPSLIHEAMVLGNHV